MRAGDRYAAQNRRARYDYLIEEKLEAGLVLQGSEVKVLRQGQGQHQRGLCRRDRRRAVPRQRQHSRVQRRQEFQSSAPRRPRKLLLHRKEMARLLSAIRREGVTIVPLSIYFNERGSGQGRARPRPSGKKKKADKRQAEKARDWQRDKARIMRARG